jgi:hypothetical protein
MSNIRQLTAVDVIEDSDLFPVYVSANGDTRKAAAFLFIDYLQGKVTATDDKITQYAAPSATGFTVQIQDSNASVWLILTPLAVYASGTIKLPLVQNCKDKQEILINTTQALTLLTVDGNGSTTVGIPTTLTANQSFKLRFDAVMKTWYNIT